MRLRIYTKEDRKSDIIENGVKQVGSSLKKERRLMGKSKQEENG